MATLLQVRGARKSFGTQQVLRGVDLSIEEGRITVLLGKSGSGKTVLLKSIAGLLSLDAGEIFFRGRPIQRNSRGRPPMSYLFQGDALFDSLSTWDNVALPLRESRAFSREQIRAKVAPLLEKLDLGEIGHKFPSELSGGMRRRVALARALVVDPEIVLFDEPTSGLDPIRRNAVLELIHRDSHRFGFTALVVSHDVPESLFIADAAAVLEDGVIALQDPPETLVGAAGPDSSLHAFLHNTEDLFHRLDFTRPESRWLLEETELRRRHATLALLDFPHDPGRLDLIAQLRHFRHRRSLLNAISALGPHVSPCYAVDGHRVLVGFKDLAPESTATALAGLHCLVPSAEPDPFLRISVGLSQPDLSLERQMTTLSNAPCRGFRVNLSPTELS